MESSRKNYALRPSDGKSLLLWWKKKMENYIKIKTGVNNATGARAHSRTTTRTIYNIHTTHARTHLTHTRSQWRHKHKQPTEKQLHAATDSEWLNAGPCTLACHHRHRRARVRRWAPLPAGRPLLFGRLPAGPPHRLRVFRHGRPSLHVYLACAAIECNTHCTSTTFLTDRKLQLPLVSC